MLHISTKGDYGLCLMLYLACREKGKFVSVKEFAEAEDFSAQYLSKIILSLKKSGLVESKEGKGGGYRLKKKADKISVLEIIESLEGPLSLVNCLSDCKNNSCNKNKFDCKTQQVWSFMIQDIKEYFNGINLKELGGMY